MSVAFFATTTVKAYARVPTPRVCPSRRGPFSADLLRSAHTIENGKKNRESNLNTLAL